MINIENQKKKLEQKKNRLSIEETKLKLKERKMRTRSLIQRGGLITTAKLDHLHTNALYGALLSLKNQLNDASNPETLIAKWNDMGKDEYEKATQSSTAVILQFNDQPSSDIRTFIRSAGLRFNRFRNEWYGNVTKLEKLKTSLGKIKYQIEIISSKD